MSRNDISYRMVTVSMVDLFLLDLNKRNQNMGAIQQFKLKPNVIMKLLA